MDDASRLAAVARAAADQVTTGMTLGLGSGSTAEAVIRELGRRVANGLTISGVPTSDRTARLADEHRIPLLTLDEIDHLDLGIDGADEIAPSLDLVKGRGGALLHEKLVALACRDYLVVAAAQKLVTRLGTRVPLPVEVVPFGWPHTAGRLAQLGCTPTLRRQAGVTNESTSGSPVRSDGGHVIVDCATDPIDDAPALAAAIKAISGVVDHGFFLGVARRALIVDDEGTVRELRPVLPR